MQLTAIAIGGILTLISLLSTVFISFGRQKGWHNIDMKWHTRMGGLTVLLGLMHGTAALLTILGYI